VSARFGASASAAPLIGGPVVQLFVIDGTVAVAIRGALDQKNRAAGCDLQSARDRFVRGDRFEPVFRFDQCKPVLLFEQREDRLGLQIVFDDLFADVFG
jgi:hypothetical protein